MAETRDRPVPLLERFERFLDAVIPPPDDVAATVRRGEALLGAGDSGGAARLADTALAVAPAYLRALLLKADALARDAPHDALVLLETAFRERSLPPAVLARMVELAARVGDERRSLELEAQTRARLRGSDPESARRLVSAARVLVARGAHASALRLARGATVVDPGCGAAWLILADDALRRGDPAQARRSLERASATLDTTDPVANRSAGEIALALGDLSAAARHLRRAWIVGDAASMAPLVMVLSRAGDTAGLDRVVADAQGTTAQIVRSLVSLSQGDESARSVLSRVPAVDIADALWPLALDITLKSATDIAERWAQEAPDRPGSLAITALAAARARIEAGDPSAARERLGPAIDDARTLERATELYRAALRASWRAQLAIMLEELAVLVRTSPALAPLESELRTRRRELDDPLRVAILGEFSAGKSTFLNALVGATVSPMGVLPTTAYVHWLRFGDPGARIVDARGGAVVATIDEAPRVVERKRDADERVEYVEVTMPVPRLARVELIDTPGFNAGEPAHEAAVRRAFAIADIALWLFDARQAGKLSETGPLQEAREAHLPVLGVLNKIDQVREGEREHLLAVVRDGFRDLAPLALSISARQALAASTTLSNESATEQAKSDARAQMVASGMASFLAYLDEHLVAQRAAWKQLRIARRVGDVLGSAQELLSRAAEADVQRERQREALLASIVALREQLATVATSVRREVAAVLREQLRGLEGRGRAERAEDLQALASDASAEIAFRARARALEQLGARLREIEKLAVESGVVSPSSTSLVVAPAIVYLDHAAADGVRDATAGSAGPSLLPGDPLSALEQAVLRREDASADRHDLLVIALAVGKEELERYTAPALPLLGPGPTPA